MGQSSFGGGCLNNSSSDILLLLPIFDLYLHFLCIFDWRFLVLVLELMIIVVSFCK